MGSHGQVSVAFDASEPVVDLTLLRLTGSLVSADNKLPALPEDLRDQYCDVLKMLGVCLQLMVLPILLMTVRHRVRQRTPSRFHRASTRSHRARLRSHGARPHRRRARSCRHRTCLCRHRVCFPGHQAHLHRQRARLCSHRALSRRHSASLRSH